MKKPEDVAQAYFAAVRAKDIDAFKELFAEDAVFVFPDGTDYVGLPAILDMERAAFANSGPTPTPRVMILSEKSVAGEADVQLADGRVIQAANLFYLNDEGEIQRLSSFTKWL